MNGLIAVHQSEFYRNFSSATLNDLREVADLSCSHGRLFQRHAPLQLKERFK